MATLKSLVPTVHCASCQALAGSHHHNTCRACGAPLSSHKGPPRERLAAVDAAVRTLPDRARRGDDLASELARCAPDALGRARAAFTWIADHVEYDVHAFLAGRRSAEVPNDVIRARRAVCAGFASLFHALCQRAGVRSEIVSGYAKGAGFSLGRIARSGENHAWNAFHDGQGWRLVDPTWGAGSIADGRFEREFRPFYFDARPDRLVFTHLPSAPRWQLLSPPVPRSTFDRLALPKSGLYTHSMGLDSHAEATVRCGRDVTISLVAATPVSVLYTWGRETEVGVLRDRRVYLPIVLPSPGEYKLDVYAHAAPCPPGTPHEQVLSYRLLWDR